MNDSLLRFLKLYAAGTATISLCFLAGCVNQQKDVAVYRQVLDGGDKAPSVRVEPGAVLTLTDALRLADINNESLGIQGETYLQSILDKDKEFAAFLPTLSISPGYSVNDTHGSPPGASNHDSNASLNANMNVFNGFSDYARMRAADRTIEQQRQLLLDAQQTILLDVIQAYYAVLTSEQQVEVLKNSLSVQQENVRYVEAQRQAGTAKPLDVAQAQAQASQTQVTLNQSVASVRTSRLQLAYLVDAPVEQNPLDDNFNPPEAVAELEKWEAQAEGSRQDLKAADQAVSAARDNVDAQFGQYYPSVTLNFNYFVYKEFDPASNVWNGAITANLPIFTGNVIHAEVRQAWSQFRQLALTQAALRRNIDQAVATAYINLNLAHQQLAELQIQVTAARDAMFRAQELYKDGGGTFLDVLTAQDTLLSTQLQLTNELFTQKTAYFNLLRATGQLQMTVEASATRPSDVQLHNLATQPVTSPSELP